MRCRAAPLTFPQGERGPPAALLPRDAAPGHCSITHSQVAGYTHDSPISPAIRPLNAVVKP